MTRTGVLVVTDVPVSPSSAAAEMCEGVSSDSDREFVEPQSFFSFQEAFDCLGGESRRCELRRDASESTTDIQEGHAAHATAELVLVNRGCAVAN